MDKRYYVFVGNQESWKKAFVKNLWGFGEKNKKKWMKIESKEYVAFYVTSPLSKIIGFGRITDKLRDNTPFWAMELYANNAIWSYRVTYDKLFLVDDWNDGISLPENIIPSSGCTIISETSYISLLKLADKKWKTKLLNENII